MAQRSTAVDGCIYLDHRKPRGQRGRAALYFFGISTTARNLFGFFMSSINPERYSTTRALPKKGQWLTVCWWSSACWQQNRSFCAGLGKAASTAAVVDYREKWTGIPLFFFRAGFDRAGDDSRRSWFNRAQRRKGELLAAGALFWCGSMVCTTKVSRYTRGSPIKRIGWLLAGFFAV